MNRFHGPVDWDLLNTVSELRRYLYGPSHSEQKIRKGLEEPSNRSELSQSVLSFYRAVNDDTVFKKLDRWLLESLFQAHRKRIRLVPDKGSLPAYSREQLRSASWFDSARFPWVNTNPRFPSFLYGWLYGK